MSWHSITITHSLTWNHEVFLLVWIRLISQTDKELRLKWQHDTTTASGDGTIRTHAQVFLWIL